MNNNSDNKKQRAGYIIYVATWINWNTHKGVFGYIVLNHADNSVLYRDYLSCDFLESASNGEMKALIAALGRIPVDKEPVLLKTSQPSIVAGISYGLDLWSKGDWITRDGGAVKCQDEWGQIHKLMSQGLRIVALEVQDEKFSALQNGCRQLLSFSEN